MALKGSWVSNEIWFPPIFTMEGCCGGLLDHWTKGCTNIGYTGFKQKESLKLNGAKIANQPSGQLPFCEPFLYVRGSYPRVLDSNPYCGSVILFAFQWAASKLDSFFFHGSGSDTIWRLSQMELPAVPYYVSPAKAKASAIVHKDSQRCTCQLPPCLPCS